MSGGYAPTLAGHFREAVTSNTRNGSMTLGFQPDRRLDGSVDDPRRPRVSTSQPIHRTLDAQRAFAHHVHIDHRRRHIAMPEELLHRADVPDHRAADVSAHFTLTDRGELALDGFGEGTNEDIVACAYPLLDRAD